MSEEANYHFICRPNADRPTTQLVEFHAVSEFLQDEPACKIFWELLNSQFHTRSKFLAVWSGVRFVAVHRDPDGQADGFLLVNAPVNWQIDYVVVRPDRRGNGIAGAMVLEAVSQAHRRGVPYVMLTCRAGLRSFYEGCGFTVVDLETAS